MDEINLTQQINTLEAYKQYLTDLEKVRLSQIIGTSLSGASAGGTSEPSINKKSDSNETIMTYMREEMELQISNLRTMRQRITAQTESPDTKQLKDLTTATTSLYTMFTKMNETMLNQSRIHKIEVAVTKAMKTLPDAAQKTFLKELERLLQQ